MAIDFNNEVTNRNLVEFNWEEVFKQKDIKQTTYDDVRNAIIADMNYMEESNLVKFQINDIEMAIPPLHIGINKENLEYSWKTLRSKASTKVFSNSAIFNVQLTLLFPRECILQLHRLILQIRNNPFICIKNKYLSSSLNSTDYHQVVKFQSTNVNGTLMKSTHFAVTNLQCVNYQASPGAFLLELDLRIFNTIPYSLDLKYRHDLKYLLPNNLAATINVFFTLNSADPTNPLEYKDRIIDSSKLVQLKLNIKTKYNDTESQETSTPSNYMLTGLEETQPTFGVEYPYESCIFVKYYNYLQVKHLYLNFNVNLEFELIRYAETNNLKIKNFDDRNFLGFQDFFNVGLYNSNLGNSYRVLSVASKYLPVKLRNKIIDEMLSGDDTFTLMYESFITLNLSSETLSKLRMILAHNVKFNDSESTNFYRNQIDKNVESLKKILTEAKDSVNKEVTITVTNLRKDYSLARPGERAIDNKKEIKLSEDEINKILAYISLTSQYDFSPDYSSLVDRRLNVFSTVEVLNLAAAATEDNREIQKLLQLKPLVVTSCSAMLTNALATIPISGYTYPTYQFLGSHEPVYQMTFAASSFGNDPENLDDLPKGIQNIETFRYEMEHNIQNFKQVPNSQAFSLDCFITKLFDSFRLSDINVQVSEGTDNQKPASRRLLKKRLSINAINTQTLEGSPGTTVGSLRFTETNNYDLEKLQLVYDSNYEKIGKYAKSIFNLAKNYCYAKSDPKHDFKKGVGVNIDDEKVKELLASYYFNLNDTLHRKYFKNPIQPNEINVITSGDNTDVYYYVTLSESFEKKQLEDQLPGLQSILILELFGDNAEGKTINAFSNTPEKMIDTRWYTDDSDFIKKINGTDTSTKVLTLFRKGNKNNPEKETRLAFSFAVNELSPYGNIGSELNYLDNLIKQTDPSKLTELEKETNNLLTLICNFNLLASSLLIEPQYYLKDQEVPAEYSALDSKFFGLFKFKAQIKFNEQDSTISPSYMRFLRYWMVNSSIERDGEKIDKAINDNISEIIKGKQGSIDPKYFDSYAETEIISSLAIGSVGGLVGYKFGWLASSFIIAASIGVKFPDLVSQRQFNQQFISYTNAQKVRTFFNKNSGGVIDKSLINLSDNENLFFQLIYNGSYGLDNKKITDILNKDKLPLLLNFGTNNQTELADIASKVTRQILNLNPVIHLYAQISEGLGKEIANAVIQPDLETSAVSSLIFNGFEQNIFSYLYWFPKNSSSTLGFDSLSSDNKYFEEIFKISKPIGATSSAFYTLSTNQNTKKLYLERNDNLKNLMIRPEWSVTFQYLNEPSVDDANQFINTLSDKIFISKEEIKKFKEERQNIDYLIFVCNKDESLRSKIEQANRSRIAYLEQLFKNLLIKVLQNTELENFMKGLQSGDSSENVKPLIDFENETNGFDVSGMHCYQDIDLPNKPLTSGKEKLNPGFFYFDNNKEIYTQEQIAETKTKSLKIAKSVLEKSNTFMDNLRKGKVYSGEDSVNILNELGKARIPTSRLGGVQTTENKETLKILTLQDASLIDFQEGGDISHLYKIDLEKEQELQDVLGDSQTNNSSVLNSGSNTIYSGIYTHPPLHVPSVNVKDEKVDEVDSDDVPLPEHSSDPLEPTIIPLYKIKNTYSKTIPDPEKADANIDVFIDQEITKDLILKSNNIFAEEKDGEDPDLAIALATEQYTSKLLGDFTLTTKNTDMSINDNKLFYASNFSLLGKNGTDQIDPDDLINYERFLKNALYSETEPSKEVILNSLSDQLGFANKRTISQMYPTFKFYIIEEDAVESENPLVFDDFYNYNAVKDITVYKNRKLPADTAVIRLQNISGSIDGGKPTGVRDIDYEMAGVDDSQQEELGKGRPEIEVSSILLRVGVTAQLRLGYDSNPNNLEVMLSGKITDINWSTNGDMCEIVLQSFGVELLAKKLGTADDGISDNFVFNNTDSVLKFMLHQSDLQHFGRFKATTNIEKYKDRPHLSIRISNPKTYEKTWLQTIKSVFEENSIATAIGISITGAILAFTAVKFPSVAKALTRAGTFINQSRFITAITLGTNKLFFRGFGASITDNVIATVSGSVTNTAVKGTSKLQWLKEILTPTWAGWFMGNVNRFRDLATKVGYNQALLRVLTSTDAAAVAATTVIKNKGVLSIMLNSFMGSVFKTFINIKLASLTLGLTAELISSSLDAFGDSLKYLLGTSSGEMSAAKKALLKATKDPKIMLSPMDDCIFPPPESHYICPANATDVAATVDETEVSEAEKRFAYTSRVILAETANSIIDIFLKSWAFGSLVDIPFGFLEYRFKVTPYYRAAGSSDITFENSKIQDEITKNPYAAADKRLYEVYGENQYRIYNKTIWESVEEMTLRHPGWVAAARPYGLGPEYRLFFGMPNAKYYRKEISETQKARFDKIFDLLFTINTDNTVTTNIAISATNEQMLKLSSSKVKRNSKLIYEEIKNKIKEQTAIDKIYGLYLKSEIVKDFYESISKRITTFRKYHYLSSDSNIVACNISVNDKAVNTVKVNYLHIGEDPSTTPNAIYTRTLQAHPYIPDDAVNEASWNESNIDTIQCKGYGAALRYGMTLLINGAKEMYDGEIITIGNPSINPFDIVLLEDKVNGVSGPVEVEAVTHMFSFETGFLTEIKPNALVTGNEAMTYSVTSTAPVFLATEQVVKRVSNRGYANGKPGEQRVVDEDTRKEIRAILADYFAVPESSVYNSLLGLNKPNFWYDYVNTSGFERMFKANTINNQELKKVTDALESAVFENIIKALEANRIDTLVNMKQGLFQIPEPVNNVIQKVNGDIFNAGATSAIVGGAINALASRFTVETLSKGWVVNTLGFLKNSGKLGAIVAVGSLVFGDQIESTIEEYMQNEGTLEGVLGLTQETRFAKINDGTLLHITPLYKNDRALLGGGFQYIRQNEIWHNRVGAIYNDISDAALGYIQARKELRAKTSFLSEEDMQKIVDENSRNPFKAAGVFLYNRYIDPLKAEGDDKLEEKYTQTYREMYLSNTEPHGMIQIDY